MPAQQDWRKQARSGVAVLVMSAMLALGTVLTATVHAAEDTAASSDAVRLSIVGGLAAVTQFSKLERPFWETEITERSNGRIVATVRPFDTGGLRAQEMLQLIRLGVVPFGTALLSVVSPDEPELDAPDLPLLNPDMESLRRTVALYREHLRKLLLDRYDIVLLGVYVYPAQVLFCRDPFSGLDDLKGRRVRTSAVGQSELMSALGAIPVIVPFADMVRALREDVADCAITGTLSGYEIGLPDVTTHIHGMAISWGLSAFGANLAAWEALPPDLRQIIADGVHDLEIRIWAQASADTDRGLACDIGATSCLEPPKRPMTLVNATADEARRTQLHKDVVLPHWVMRCGKACASAWNTHLAAATGITIGTESSHSHPSP